MRTLLLLLVALLVGAGPGRAASPQRAAGALRQSAYIWQRQWSPSVTDAVRRSPEQLPGVTQLWPLVAELSCTEGRIESQSVAVDYHSLQGTQAELGAVVRIGPCPSATMQRPEVIAALVAHVEDALGRAHRAGIQPRELQIDFDSTTAQLDHYQRWLAALRGAIKPTPLTITALPTWLDAPAFERVLEATDGWVLQVHGLAPPKDLDHPMVIFERERALRWIERAAQLGRPFRVSLPTYGYVAAFDDTGAFAALAAEQAPTAWAPEMTVVASRSDPTAIAGLVKTLEHDRPAQLVGLAWFRLPVSGDRLAWSTATLRSVTEGHVPASSAVAEVRTVEPGLLEIDVVNPGPIDHALDRGVVLRWSVAPPLAADGLAGFAWRPDEQQGHFVPDDPTSAILPAGQRRTIGWIRMKDHNAELDATLL